MSATARVYAEVNLTLNGQYIGFGKRETPFKEVTIPGTGVNQPQRFQLAGGETKILWSYEQQRDFELLWLYSDGYVQLAVKVDTPQSSSNLAPSGTYDRWRQLDRSCVAPLILDTDNCLINPSLTDEAASDATGLPRVLTSSGAGSPSVTGKIYALAVKNPGTAVVNVELAVVN